MECIELDNYKNQINRLFDSKYAVKPCKQTTVNANGDVFFQLELINILHII